MIREKAKKQIMVNLFIVIFSAIVVFVAKSVYGGEIATFESCLGSDAVFIMITSMATSIGWRSVEQIHNWIWDAFVFLFLLILAIIYGSSILSLSSAMISFIKSMTVAFLFFTFGEYKLIFCHFKRQEIASKQNSRCDYLGYILRENR